MMLELILKDYLGCTVIGEDKRGGLLLHVPNMLYRSPTPIDQVVFRGLHHHTEKIS